MIGGRPHPEPRRHDETLPLEAAADRSPGRVRGRPGDGGRRAMADAIQAGVRLNHPADAFAAELKKVAEVLGALDLRKGDQVTLTALPRVGLRCQVVGKTDVLIENPAFAKAVWDIYLG